MSIKVTKKSGIQQDGNIVQQLLFRYLPYWPLFVVMLILGVAAAYLYIRYAVPVYQANASILIKDKSKDPEHHYRGLKFMTVKQHDYHRAEQPKDNSCTES